MTGTWFYEYDNDVGEHDEYFEQFWTIYAGSLMDPIAKVDYDKEDAARLMAAAPELLHALQLVVKVADRATIEFDTARAAIAKATGEKA